MRKLRVFLCHATEDKPAVRTLYASLKSVPWIDPWLDEENLLPGQDFDLEIYKATRDADAIIICLSKISVTKEGYVNKEIRRALDIAEEKPEGAIYVIPLRLDNCIPSFERLKRLQWVDYFTPNAHEKLLKSLRVRADGLKIEIPEKTASVQPTTLALNELDFYSLIRIPPTEEVPYSFYIGKYPVTNAQYDRFCNAQDFSNPIYWLEFSEFDEDCKRMGDWGKEGLDWLQGTFKENGTKVLKPRYWDDKIFGRFNPHNPVVGISWFEASAYCEWLFQNWHVLLESEVNSAIFPNAIRLPLETEWVTAAGGDKPDGRYPWDEAGKATTSLKEILRRANVKESEIGRTTPVHQYPLGKSPFGVMDMAGNVWEWQANYSSNKREYLGLRGGSWSHDGEDARVSVRYGNHPDYSHDFGFRVVLALPSG